VSRAGTTSPRATYRLQLNKEFGFAAAAAQAPYLAALGISHVYLSPILKARAGSTHGYDTVDHQVLNPELGTLAQFRDMAARFKALGLGIVLDIVPNHMGVGGHENALWLDVLEWGEQSRYADWFDIDWLPAEPSLQRRLLVPFLGTSYAQALANGDLELRLDAAAGAFSIWIAGTHKLPLAVESYAQVLAGLAGFEDLVARCGALAGGSRDKSRAAADAIKQTLSPHAADGPMAAALAERLAHLGSEAGREGLDRLIGVQHWRPARYSVAADEINYRRFFIVSDLAGLRVERDEVFDHVHALIFQLVEDELVDGLRVDHIDGLFDPKAYCLKLRARCPRPVWLVVEKILAPEEMLPADWVADGTTGYEFASETMQLLTDPQGEVALTQGYEAFTGDRQSVVEVERAAKLAIMDFEMAAELGALARGLKTLAGRQRDSGDLSLGALGLVLKHFVASLPVYRTYVDAGPSRAADRAVIVAAMTMARRAAPTLDPAAFDFVQAVATGDMAEGLMLARRIQQFSGPVMAKGLEDTALYRCNRLLSASDVGQRPDRFSLSVADYHATTGRRAAAYGQSLLASSSHDSKRGEDVRARLAVLSGLPELWRGEVARWHDLLAAAGAPAIDANDLYVLFQLLLGAWPTVFGPETQLAPAALAGFAERLESAMIKGLREARLRSSWVQPDKDYEARIGRLIAVMLTPAAENGFLAAFRAFEARLAPLGAQNGLILSVLKLTVPGVPDIYQGAEFWEQSLVDPDNRRAVDFAARTEALADAAPMEELIGDFRSGRLKQRVVAALLALRAARPALFAQGSYQPIEMGEGFLAFERRRGSAALLVAVRLYPWRQSGWDRPRLAPDTGRAWEVVVGERARDGGRLVADFDRLPVLVAVSDQV